MKESLLQMSSHGVIWINLMIYLKTSGRSEGCVWVGSSLVQFGAGGRVASLLLAAAYSQAGTAAGL